MAQERGESRLKALQRAHRKRALSYSPRAEDYLELVYELIREKGYARTIDLSRYLAVKKPSVTNMLKRMHEEGLLIYERYKKVRLTPEGERLAKSLRERHGVLVKFFSLLGLGEETAHKSAEGIEHHLDARTLQRLEKLVRYIESHPDWRGELEAHPQP